MAACLWHTTHPLLLRAVQVVGAGYLSPLVVNAFLTLIQIV